MNDQERAKRKECVDLYLILTEKGEQLRVEINAIDKRIAEIDQSLGIGDKDKSIPLMTKL